MTARQRVKEEDCAKLITDMEEADQDVKRRIMEEEQSWLEKKNMRMEEEERDRLTPCMHTCMLRPGPGHTRARGSIRRKLNIIRRCGYIIRRHGYG